MGCLDGPVIAEIKLEILLIELFSPDLDFRSYDLAQERTIICRLQYGWSFPVFPPITEHLRVKVAVTRLEDDVLTAVTAVVSHVVVAAGDVDLDATGAEVDRVCSGGKHCCKSE